MRRSRGALIVAGWWLIESASWLLILGMLVLRLLILRHWLAVASRRGITVKNTAEHVPKLPPKGGQELHGADILGLAGLGVALLGVTLLWVALRCLTILGRW